jgi:CubicO group peptidase (beta-lactamase class C family)
MILGNYMNRFFLSASALLAIIVIFIILGLSDNDIRTFTGINELSPQLQQQIDKRVEEILPNYKYINLSLVKNGNIILTKCYGRNQLSKTHVYASVSKPVTATIIFRLLQENRISNIDDDISKYHNRYKNTIPENYGDSYISFKNLLCHTSGVPHQSKLWNGSKLRLEFKPGTNTLYSSHGYGILGDVMEEITGKSYRSLVKEYIGKPIGAESFTVRHSFFDAPAGQVASTIEDMARFAVGIMNEKYYPKDILLTQILTEYARVNNEIIGLGWYVTNPNQLNVAGYHAGSNGKPKAFLAIKPNQGNAIALTGLNNSSRSANDFGSLTMDLMAILEGRNNE